VCQVLAAVGCGGFGVDGVEHAGGVDESGSRVHADGDTERFGNFFFRSAGFESGLCVHNDAAIAVGRDGNGQRDQLASFLAQYAGLRIGGAERLIAANRVRREFHQLADSGADLLMVLVPGHHHGFLPCLAKRESRAIILSCHASMISSPIHPKPPGSGEVVAAPHLSSSDRKAVEFIPRSRIHEEFV
jgi:hypothetical protein